MKQLHIFLYLFLVVLLFTACPNTPPNPDVCTTCVAPTGLQAIDIQDTAIRIQWNVVQTADFYRLKVLDSNGVVIRKMNVPKDTSHFQINGLVSENLYVMRLMSYCHVGTDTCFSDSMSIQARTVASGGGHVVVIEDNIDGFTGTCSPIATFSEGNGLIINRKGTCIQLAWTPPKDARNYILAYRPVNAITNSNSTDCANIAVAGNWFCRMLSGVPTKASTMNFHMTCLCPGTVYQVKVLAYPTSYSCLNFATLNQWNCSSVCN